MAVGADPVGQALGPPRLGIGVIGGAEDGDEDLRLADLTAGQLGDLDGLAGEVDEHLLAGDMGLAHGRRQPARPGAVAFAEPAVAVALGLPSAVLLPQQGEGDAWPAQLQVEHCPVGLGPDRAALGRRREQQPLQGRIVELTGQWPGEPGASCPGQVLAGRGRPDAERTGDPPLGQATGKMEA